MNLKEVIRNKSKLIYGTDTVLKAAQSKKVSAIFVASNYPKSMSDKFSEISESNKVTVERVERNSEELGALLRKPFLISVIGVKK